MRWKENDPAIQPKGTLSSGISKTTSLTSAVGKSSCDSDFDICMPPKKSKNVHIYRNISEILNFLENVFEKNDKRYEKEEWEKNMNDESMNVVVKSTLKVSNGSKQELRMQAKLSRKENI